MTIVRPDFCTPIPFDAHKQCCWCGSDNQHDTPGYAGERCCHVCGHGGDGTQDIPCMFYKIATPDQYRDYVGSVLLNQHRKFQRDSKQ